ncbi:hypothetical protein [Lactobacillus crispatus]
MVRGWINYFKIGNCQEKYTLI